MEHPVGAFYVHIRPPALTKIGQSFRVSCRACPNNRSPGAFRLWWCLPDPLGQAAKLPVACSSLLMCLLRPFRLKFILTSTVLCSNPAFDSSTPVSPSPSVLRCSSVYPEIRPPICGSLGRVPTRSERSPCAPIFAPSKPFKINTYRDAHKC